jgi:hypothetical protein
LFEHGDFYVLDHRLCGKKLLKLSLRQKIPDFVLYRSFIKPNDYYFLTNEIQRHIAAVQKQTRYDLDRLAQRVGRIARAFHECQELDDSFLFDRTFEVELIGETPTG